MQFQPCASSGFACTYLAWFGLQGGESRPYLIWKLPASSDSLLDLPKTVATAVTTAVNRRDNLIKENIVSWGGPCNVLGTFFSSGSFC